MSLRISAMVAHAAGALQVLATDQRAVLSYLADNVAANPQHSIEVATLEWGTDMEAWGAQHGWDWGTVLGADLTFNRDSFLPLLFTLQQLLSRSSSPKHMRCALLLHDDDSVPGGHRLRVDFFAAAAPRYFNVAQANLQQLATGADFHSDTVHGYWLTLRDDVALIRASDCAADLQKLSDAIARDATTPVATGSHTRRPALGVTLPELLAHFQKEKCRSEASKAPASSAAVTPPNGERTCSMDAKAHEGGTAHHDAQPALAPSAGSEEGNAVATAAQPGREEQTEQREASGAHWWDVDLEEPEPFEFTEEMLRGIAQSKGPWIDPQNPASWEELVAQEATAAAQSAGGLWRHVDVDTSHLPSIAGDDDDADDDDDGEVDEIVDIDALRAAARERANVEQPSETAQELARHAKGVLHPTVPCTTRVPRNSTATAAAAELSPHAVIAAGTQPWLPPAAADMPVAITVAGSTSSELLETVHSVGACGLNVADQDPDLDELD